MCLATFAQSVTDAYSTRPVEAGHQWMNRKIDRGTNKILDDENGLLKQVMVARVTHDAIVDEDPELKEYEALMEETRERRRQVAYLTAQKRVARRMEDCKQALSGNLGTDVHAGLKAIKRQGRQSERNGRKKVKSTLPVEASGDTQP